MHRDPRLLFGLWAAIAFGAGTIALAAFVPGYDPIRQSVSEIGEVSSPMRWPFAILLWAVALCVFVFAFGLWRARPSERKFSPAIAVFCTAWMGVAAAGIAWFAHPMAAHNLFGISQIIAYQAPLAFAIAWRGEQSAHYAIMFSLIMYALTLASLVFNLSVIFGDDSLWRAIEPLYGLVQRSLFAGFFTWCAGAAWLLWSRRK